jgi:hypothetical protein
MTQINDEKKTSQRQTKFGFVYWDHYRSKIRGWMMMYDGRGTMYDNDSDNTEDGRWVATTSMSLLLFFPLAFCNGLLLWPFALTSLFGKCAILAIYRPCLASLQPSPPPTSIPLQWSYPKYDSYAILPLVLKLCWTHRAVYQTKPVLYWPCAATSHHMLSVPRCYLSESLVFLPHGHTSNSAGPYIQLS